VLHLIPWDERVQLDPAIVAREFAAKRQEEVFRRELMTRLASVHVEKSGRLFGRNRRICAHFTARNRSDSLQRYRTGLFQDALTNHDIINNMRLIIDIKLWMHKSRDFANPRTRQILGQFILSFHAIWICAKNLWKCKSSKGILQ
jgi:hypothetical protein